MIKTIKKEKSKYLNDVFTFKNRTIAIRFIVTTEELEKQWEEFQFELANFYQYDGTSKFVWDYYLVFLCAFDDGSLDSKLRFKIENDRFCCRKMFLFDFPEKKYSPEKVALNLFPEIETTKSIQIIKPETLIQKIDPNLTNFFDERFFIHELSESEIEETIISLATTGGANE